MGRRGSVRNRLRGVLMDLAVVLRGLTDLTYKGIRNILGFILVCICGLLWYNVYYLEGQNKTENIVIERRGMMTETESLGDCSKSYHGHLICTEVVE